MSVELKVGQVWKDRSGRKIAIVKNTTGRNKDSHPFMSFGSPWTYRSDGGFAYFSGMTHERDLIELVQDENGWRPWKATANSQCPVSDSTFVEIRVANGVSLTNPKKAGDCMWGHRGGGYEIVAYRIVEEASKLIAADGWMPWVATEYSECPVSPQTIVRVRGKSGSEAECKAGNVYWCARGDDKMFDPLVAYKVIKEASKTSEPSAPQRTPSRHSHYFKDVSQINEIDVYRVCELFGVDDPSGATQHAVKKLLCAGQRGAKDRAKDYQEAIDTLTRRVEMWVEGQQ